MRMRRKWITKVAAVCLSAAMTATPAVQSFAAEEATSAIQTEMLEQDLQKEQTEEDDISVMAEEVESEAESEETVTEGSMPESESVPETEESAEETIAENVEETQTTGASEITEAEITEESSKLETEESESFENSSETESDEAIEDISEEVVEEESETQEEDQLKEDQWGTERPVVPFVSGDFQYTILGEETILLKYTGSEANLTIPSYLDGHKINDIGEKAFYECSSIINVVVPEQVSWIGKQAFYGCQNLQSITITGRTSIGEDAISHCPKLEHINLSDSITLIGRDAFSYNESLKSIVLPEKLKRLDVGVLEGCSSLEEVVIKGNVTSIEYAAFMYTALKKVVLPSSVNYLGWYAFGFCNNLETVYFPTGVSYRLEQMSFEGSDNCVFYVERGSWMEQQIKYWKVPYQYINSNFTGLLNAGENLWYYQRNGRIQWSYTGLVMYEGTRYYIKNGIVD